MAVANPTIVMIGIFFGVFLVLASIALAVGLLGNQKKVLSARLSKVKARHLKGAGGPQPEKKSLFIKQEKSFFDQFVPRPQELRRRLKKTGYNIDFTKYLGASFILMVVFALIAHFPGGLSLVPSLMLGLLGGLALPHMVVSALIKKRLEKFTTQFPEAIDLIVRGLKAGLPVTESIGAVSREMQDPIAVEFRRIIDDVRLGKTLDEALWKAAERLDTPEFKFFVISLAVQQETGGNLTETLGNLSGILRSRSQLKLKVKAMSSEGKASAYIIGSLPFIMCGVLLMLNYDYMSILFTDPRGQVAALGGLVWMGIGLFIISKLINFEV
ncbi:type II secretion system F family protein [Luteithermobacter gelatinilyticus]|uniref:type II secretion system F family protein n=1 Tax=Luteithermobacter gelatinilyticus TaxID=2582913 RepID=UPI0011072409|nr:type II secretion system F family protein [Luteithermobacter gelatinilyticus]|tara:strand:+ start:2451 stop:3431 length:981 start_codon:yes stop_codon:yes gene_type:complete